MVKKVCGVTNLAKWGWTK